MNERMCDLTVGTDGDYPIDCNAPAAIRYRPISDTFGPWRGRCSVHANELDRDFVQVEVLAMNDPDDPTTIKWDERQARALIPFKLDEDGRPIAPVHCSISNFLEPQSGRNGLPLWGENPEAAALVTCTYAGRRWVLLVQRPDDGTWAMPSGPIEPDWVWYEAARRVCHEETGLVLDPDWMDGQDEPRWVPDPRGSMEAWVALVPVRFDLGGVESLPEAYMWMDVRNLDDPSDIFPAHREILAGVR